MIKFKSFWWIISILTPLCFSCNAYDDNPREMNGKTTLDTKDSTYYITFKIDSVTERIEQYDDR